MEKYFLLSICLVYSSLTFPKTSGNETTKRAMPDSAKVEDKGSFTFGGYFDTYYMANLNNPSTRSNLGASGYERAFDQKAGQFSLGLVQAKMQYTNAKSDVVIDLTFGPNAMLGNYGNALGNSFAIKQAYIDYKISDKLTFTAGQFGTHIGYEVIDAPINFHYSLSNLFNNGPFYHIGAKGTYAFSDKVSLMVGLVNNVDNLNDNNRKKGLISQLFISPKSGWNVYLNGIYSNEATEDPTTGITPDAHYAMLDLTTSYQMTDKFLLGLNAAIGTEKGEFQGSYSTKPNEEAKWGGAAIYSTYAVSNKFSLGGRYEHFNNADGARGLKNTNEEGTSVNSLTLTGNLTLANGHFLVKPEFRIDNFAKSTTTEQQQFVDSSGKATKNSQSTLGLAFIYKF